MPSGPSRQGDQPGRREDPGLAHPAADHLPGAARAPDDVAPADDDRADRAGEPLRQAERDGVGRIGQVRRADALGDDRVPEPGAVDVERDAVGVRDRRRPAGCTSAVSGWPIEWAWVFSMVTRPVIGSCGSFGSRKAASISAGSTVPSGRSSSERMLVPTMTAWPAASSMTRWCSRPAIVSWPRREVRHLGDEVAHRARGDEQAGFLAEQLGGALLERVDGRVVAEHVVADARPRPSPGASPAWAG